MVSKTTTELLANQSTSVKDLSAKMSLLNDVVYIGLGSLETGFDRLGNVLDHTEQRISSWNRDSRIVMVAGVVGFAMGTSVGMTRWIVMGTSTSDLLIMGLFGSIILSQVRLPTTINLTTLVCVSIASGISHSIFQYYRRRPQPHLRHQYDFIAGRSQHDLQRGDQNGYTREARYASLCI